MKSEEKVIAKEIDRRQLFDSRGQFFIAAGTDTLTLVTPNGKFKIKGKEELRIWAALMNKSVPVITDADKIPSAIAPRLTRGSILCDVIFTNESMGVFVTASRHLLDKDYLESLREKKLRRQDLPISSRVLNDWTNKRNLLEDNRENLEQWHTFSKIDLMYIHILKACRDFGISIRKLQNARDSFTTKLNRTDFSLIEIAYAYFDKAKDYGDVYLFMDESGKCSIVRAEDIILMAQEKMIFNNFILNLNEVCNGI